MNDDSVPDEVREPLIAESASLAGVHMERPAEAVMARGQVLRLRRRLLHGVSGVTAAGAAMALALALPLSGTAPGVRQVHVNEMDWSVNTGQNGTVIVALRKLSEPVLLQYVLGEAGIPATVGAGTSCLAPGWVLPAKSIVDWHVISAPPLTHGEPGRRYVYTIHPARIPAHTRFVVMPRPLEKARSQPRHGLPVMFALVPAGRRPACAASTGATPSPNATPSLPSGASPNPAFSPFPTPSLPSGPSATPAPSPFPTPRPHETPSP